MLVVQPVTPADIPAITDLWYEAFRTSGFLELIPDTPGIRQWWNKANQHDLLHKPTARYWKVVDDADGTLIAYAKWDMESAEERGDRFPPWHADMNQACSGFFERLERQRRELLGGKKNYCTSSLSLFCLSPFPYALPLPPQLLLNTSCKIRYLHAHCCQDLDMLCTHPRHRGRGAGSMLVARGCEEVDRDRVPAYVDASHDGEPVYARYGFKDRTIPGLAAEGVKNMVREPKS